MRLWIGFVAAAMSLFICGSASAQLVNVLYWTNNTVAPAANVHSATWDLNDNTTVLVVGMYGDNSPANNGFSSVTFGGVPPTGMINSSSSTRLAMAYWINPNTAGDQTLSYTYSSPNQGYYWAYELSNVDTNAPVATSGSQVLFGTSASLTTVTNNSFVISYFAGNNSQNGNALTPNPPLVQNGTTINGATAGASMASATNTIATPGLVNVTWNRAPGNNLAQYGVAAMAFVPADIGAPIVGGSIYPLSSANDGDFDLTVTIDPFHTGTVTNVSVDLSSIGGPSANALVATSDPNVWTNRFTVPSVPSSYGTIPLRVTAIQDVEPTTGVGYVPIQIVFPSAPTLVTDTSPNSFFNMYVGQGVRLSASFTGPGFISYQWQKSLDSVNYTDIPGATGTAYSIPSVTMGDAAYYRLQATNIYGPATSSGTSLTIYNPSPSTYIWSAAIPYAGLTAEQILTNFPTANKIVGAMVAKDGGNPITVTLTNAANQSVVFAGAGNWASLSNGVSYISNVSTNKTGNASFDSVLNSGYNGGTAHAIKLSGLVVGQKYQVQLFALDNRSGLTPDASQQTSAYHDPADGNGITSQPFTMADNVYVLATFTAATSEIDIEQDLLASAGNFNGVVLRSVGWDPPPYFVVQPKNVNNFLGTPVSLTASAAADSTVTDPTINYQWQKGPSGGPYTDLSDVTKYAGMTSSTLTISNLVAADGDSVYVLKATDSGGSALSAEGHVYVQGLPILPPMNSFAQAVLDLTNVPNSRLAGLWQLNETNDPSTGLLVAYDASGKGRHGTYGATSQNKFNGVLSPQPPEFNGFTAGQGALQTGTGGNGDNTSVVSLPPLNLTNVVDTTIAMWIKPTGLAPNLGGLLFNRGADQSGFGFGGTQGGPSNQRNLGFLWNNANGEATYNYNSGLFPVNDQWNFVVLVMRTNAATFYLRYVDTNGAAFFGEAADTAARYTQNNWTGQPISIGGDLGQANTIFPGSIANVAVFNSALTKDQVNTLFAAGFQVTGFPAAFLQQPPANSTAYNGYTLQISAQNGGTAPFTNQWRFNGTNLVDGWYSGSIISGSTSNVLTIIGISTNWQGVYSVTVTNALGGSVSSNANVVVLPTVTPPSANLVGQWFDGTASLADHSGHLPGTHDGYGVGPNGTQYRFTNSVPPGKSGSSLNLYGGTSIGISNSASSDAGYVNTFDDGIASSFTVAVWARGQPGQWNPFVSKYGETTPSPEGGWQLRRNNNTQTAAFTIRGSSGTDDMAAASGGSGADGAWHLYVGTYDSVTSNRTLYVDGFVQAAITNDGPYTLAPGARLVLGGRSTNDVVNNLAGITGTANFTGGFLYDVRIYNTALSEAQQASLAVPPLPPLNITGTPVQGSPGQMTLTWLNGGKLLQATNILGPWVTNQVATPPYTIQTTNVPGLFYRVIFP